MNRKDMQPGVLYAIKADGYNPRPGIVLDAGKPPNKVKVKVYWSWEGWDDDYLNPEPTITGVLAKSDIKTCDTNGVQGLWSDYCAKVKAERKVLLDKKQAEDDAVEAERQADMMRVSRVTPFIGEDAGKTLVWIAKRGGNMGTYNFSARQVLDIIEGLLSDSRVSQ